MAEEDKYYVGPTNEGQAQAWFQLGGDTIEKLEPRDISNLQLAMERNPAAFTDAQRAQIEDIVKRKTGVAAESIVITPLSQSKNASDVINTADEAEKNTGGAEDNAESTGEEVQDTAASVESDSADQTSEDAETAADIQNDQTIDTEGIYD